MAGTDDVDGIDAAAVTDWLRHRTSVTPPMTFAVIEGGRSNLTYTVSDAAGNRLILRRPPLHGVIESAHDMAREHRIIAALAGTPVPVPTTIGYEPDPGVTGAEFYVMEHVEGAVLRDAAAARTLLAEPLRATASDAMVDTLVALHAVDPDAVGLGDLARREGYLARQLKRWHGQLAATRTRELPLLDEVHARLVADLPQQGPATIVHGDYRLDNVILDPRTGEVAAVLDWELTTLGDPLADLGLLLVYWAEAGDETIPLLDSPTLLPGFADRARLVERYAHATGRDVSHLDVYVAFGYWKLACILEGVYSRYASGAYGDTGDSFRVFGDIVLQLGERAAEAVAAAGR